MNVATPATINNGDRNRKSIDSTCATMLVPTLAPSTIASAMAVPINSRLANEAVISVVAVLLCNAMVVPRPAKKALTRLRVEIASQ